MHGELLDDAVHGGDEPLHGAAPGRLDHILGERRGARLPLGELAEPRPLELGLEDLVLLLRLGECRPLAVQPLALHGELLHPVHAPLLDLEVLHARHVLALEERPVGLGALGLHGDKHLQALHVGPRALDRRHTLADAKRRRLEPALLLLALIGQELALERDRIARLGLSVDRVADAVAGGLGGVAASELRETDGRTPIRVRLAGGGNESLDAALATLVGGVPVGQLLSVREVRAPTEVVRVNQRPVVMVEATLIVERGGLKSLIDGLIVVTADEETQIERLIRDKGYKREEAVSRLRVQMPAREKMMHGDYIIDNSGSLEDTRARVKAVSEAIGL